MPLPPKDFTALQEMQSLCTELESDIQALAAFRKRLAKVDARYKKLGALYQDDWLRLAESPRLSAAQKQQIEDMVALGGYSVLGQDTIWNALDALRGEYTALLKSLAQKI